MKSHLCLLIFVLLLVSCCWGDDDDDVFYSIECNERLIIDDSLFISSTTDAEIIQIELFQDCLEITYNASGCDGNTWNEQLIASTEISETNPDQRNLKFVLNNTELCQAYITQTQSYDISQIKDENSEQILKLEGWEEPILYAY